MLGSKFVLHWITVTIIPQHAPYALLPTWFRWRPFRPPRPHRSGTTMRKLYC